MTGDRQLLALQLPPGPAFLDAWDAAWGAGDAILPLRPALPPAERDRLLAALRPHALVTPQGRSALPDPAPLDARTDLVVATSGTTGPPKGVELSREAVEACARASLERLGAGPGRPWLCCLPLDHLAGLQVVLRARLAAAPLVLHDGFSVDAVAAAPGVAFVSLVPTMLRRLLDARADLARFDAILLGGAAAPPGLLEEARRAGARVVTTYGMTETSGGCVYDGVPLDGIRVEVRSDGRVRLAGPALFHGYRLDAERTRAALRDGWFVTADVGEWAGGRLRVLGRADDVVVSGGENVSAAEVAGLLETHPGVAEAGVTGASDPEWGQALVAVVVPRDPAAPPTLEELRAHVRERAAAFKAPRRLILAEALPRTPLGKPDAAALAALAAGPSSG